MVQVFRTMDSSVYSAVNYFSKMSTNHSVHLKTLPDPTQGIVFAEVTITFIHCAAITGLISKNANTAVTWNSIMIPDGCMTVV